VRHWEKIAATAPGDSSFMQQLRASIDEARQLAGMPRSAKAAPAAPVMAETQAAAPTATQAQAPAAAASGSVRGTVRLSPAMAKFASPTDTVFVLARAAEGPRMPLAIQRMQVKDLPATFSLDDSMAMSPGTKLSLFPKVVIAARISKSGQAIPVDGDLLGQSAPVAPGATGLLIEINEVVKK
jgi:cytochrome c-type biogenesis protein CcmH